MPRWKTCAGLLLTWADCRFSLSPQNANVSREQGRSETQGSISAPFPTPAYAHGPLISPSCHLPSSRWTEQAGGQHRMQRSMSPPAAEGPSFPMLHPAWKATGMGNATPPARHTTGKVMSFVLKEASNSLISFNWVRPGFRALVMQRWEFRFAFLPFIKSYHLCIGSVWLSVMFQVSNFKLL